MTSPESESSSGRAKDAVDRRLLMLVAKFHHIDGLTLDELKELPEFESLSRSSLGRLAKRASRLVEKKLIGPNEPCLGIALRSRFGLRDAVVVEAGTQSSIPTVLGAAAASYFNDEVKSGSKVGISCGSTLLQMVLNLPTIDDRRLEIAPLSVEGPSEHVEEAPSTLVGIIKAKSHPGSSAFGGHLLVAGDPDIDRAYRSCISRTTEFKRTVGIVRNADWIFLGIGTARPYAADRQTITPYFIALMNAATSGRYEAAIEQHGFVGEINNEPYNYRGHSGYKLDPDLGEISTSFVIRICDLAQITAMSKFPERHRIVGVAGGQAKVPAIRTALEHQMINVLITDRETAERLLDRGR